jgi:tRNA modification GTPase
VVLVVVDGSQPLEAADVELLRETSALPRLVVGNKHDLTPAWSSTDVGEPVAFVSSKTGEGLDALRRQLRSTLEGSRPTGAASVPRDTAAVTNVRHAALLERAREALRRACESVDQPGGPVPEEFVLTDLQDARAALEEVTGKRASEALLRHIFSRFCIGK